MEFSILLFLIFFSNFLFYFYFHFLIFYFLLSQHVTAWFRLEMNFLNSKFIPLGNFCFFFWISTKVKRSFACLSSVFMEAKLQNFTAHSKIPLIPLG